MQFNLSEAFGVHADALRLRSYRAELLSSNLANADTPGFQAREVDFRALLERAHGDFAADERAIVGDISIDVRDAQHIGSGDGPAGPNPEELLYRVPLQPSVDGNTVEAHIEKAQFMENALRYNAELTFLNNRISGLLSAIRGE